MTHADAGELGQVARPAHHLVEAVVGEVEDRRERVVVGDGQPPRAARLLRRPALLRHQRLHRQQVVEQRRGVGLQVHALGGLRRLQHRRRAALGQGGDARHADRGRRIDDGRWRQRRRRRRRGRLDALLRRAAVVRTAPASRPVNTDRCAVKKPTLNICISGVKIYI